MPGDVLGEIRVISPLRGTTISIGLWTSGQPQLALQLLFSEPETRSETLKSSPFQYENISTKEVRTVGCRQQKRNEKVLTVQIHTKNTVIHMHTHSIVCNGVSSCSS